MDTRVSMVEARCRALMAAARWNGHAAQATTGRARIAATQPQLGVWNWTAGIIDIAKTGTVSTAATTSSGRREGAAVPAGNSVPAGSPASSTGAPGYLADRTVAL